MENKVAFIFDMDGTMLDNMKYHLMAWEKIVSELGGDLKGEELMKQLYGKNSEILKRIFGVNAFGEEEIEKISKRKEEYFRQFYAPHIKLIKGLKEFLIRSHEDNILLAIGTAEVRENIDFALKELSIRHLFSAIVDESEVAKSKPDPKTFLKAAEKLKVLPTDCIVFEDVPKGVEAARRAGMKAVAVLTSHKKEEFDSFDNVLRTIADFSVLKLEDLYYLST